jgi:hypothetical protein
MVLRYAHLSSDHLRSAANRIGIYDAVKGRSEKIKKLKSVTNLLHGIF